MCAARNSRYVRLSEFKISKLSNIAEYCISLGRFEVLHKRMNQKGKCKYWSPKCRISFKQRYHDDGFPIILKMLKIRIFFVWVALFLRIFYNAQHSTGRPFPRFSYSKIDNPRLYPQLDPHVRVIVLPSCIGF